MILFARSVCFCFHRFKGFYSLPFEEPLRAVLKSFSYTPAMPQYSDSVPVGGLLGSGEDIVLSVIDCNFLLAHRHLGWRRSKFWGLVCSLVSIGLVFCL